MSELMRGVANDPVWHRILFYLPFETDLRCVKLKDIEDILPVLLHETICEVYINL